MTLSEYTQLKQQIVLSVGGSQKHGELVTMLKKLFKDVINSPRRYEQIKTIGDLLEILEIRDVLSANDVGLLEHIAKRVPNSEDLIHKIKQYTAMHPAPSENINYYGTYLLNHYLFVSLISCTAVILIALFLAQQSLHMPTYTESSTSFMINNPLPLGMSKKKSERMHMTLVEEIGTYWRDLGRNLGIAEGMIDQINLTNDTLKSKACTLLQEYEEKKADPQRWFFHLCQALERTRRRDLSRKLQDIMTMAL